MDRKWLRRLPGGRTAVLAGLCVGLTVAPARAERTTYTSQAGYQAALAAAGYELVREGFEDDDAWGHVRTTVVGGTVSAPSVTNLGVTWTSNNAVSEVTTGPGPARTGEWGFFALPHGDWQNGINDGWIATHETGFHGFGGWIETNTPYAAVIFLVDGDVVDFEDVVIGTQHQFLGVIDTDGFTQVEILETEAGGDELKYIFADDFRYGVAPGGCTDLDGDGYGAPASASCTYPEPDCDDHDPAVNPGAAEIPGNGLDDDCDPTTPGGCEEQR